MVLLDYISNGILNQCSFLQNVVNLGAVKVTSNPNIEYIDPEKRNCYFDHEHPPNYPLTAHQKYSQVWIRGF